MSKRSKATRAQIRAQRDGESGAGVYGVDAQDAEADSWIGRYLCFAQPPAEARARIRNAGFHKQRIQAIWTPRQVPPEGVPAHLAAEDTRWCGSRLNDSGWTGYDALPPEYNHSTSADGS